MLSCAQKAHFEHWLARQQARPPARIKAGQPHPNKFVNAIFSRVTASSGPRFIGARALSCAGWVNPRPTCAVALIDDLLLPTAGHALVLVTLAITSADGRRTPGAARGAVDVCHSQDCARVKP